MRSHLSEVSKKKKGGKEVIWYAARVLFIFIFPLKTVKSRMAIKSSLSVKQNYLPLTWFNAHWLRPLRHRVRWPMSGYRRIWHQNYLYLKRLKWTKVSSSSTNSKAPVVCLCLFLLITPVCFDFFWYHLFVFLSLSFERGAWWFDTFGPCCWRHLHPIGYAVNRFP